jgi:hypothetical protein
MTESTGNWKDAKPKHDRGNIVKGIANKFGREESKETKAGKEIEKLNQQVSQYRTPQKMTAATLLGKDKELAQGLKKYGQATTYSEKEKAYGAIKQSVLKEARAAAKPVAQQDGRGIKMQDLTRELKRGEQVREAARRAPNNTPHKNNPPGMGR